MQRVLILADEIIGPGEQLAVAADRVRAERVERLAGGERVDVEQDLLDTVERALARVDLVLLPALVTFVIVVAVLEGRDARLFLVDARTRLGDQRVLELLHRREHRVRIRILGIEVRDDVGGFLRVVAQPVVRIASRAVRRDDIVRAPRRDRRLNDGRCDWPRAGCRLGRRAGARDESEKPRAAHQRDHTRKKNPVGSTYRVPLTTRPARNARARA